MKWCLFWLVVNFAWGALCVGYGNAFAAALCGCGVGLCVATLAIEKWGRA